MNSENLFPSRNCRFLSIKTTQYMTICLIALCLLFVAVPVHADLLLDQSPITTGGTITPGGSWVYENVISGQNFAERIIFGYDVIIEGISIYSFSHWARLGRDVEIRTWDESGGNPDTGSLSSFSTILSVVDTDGIGVYAPITSYYGVRAHADFGLNSFLLSANTPLWIGMTGIDNLIAPKDLGLFGLTGLASPADGKMAQFSGDSFQYLATETGDMAMRIYGERVVSSAPEPVTMLLLGLGLAGLAGVSRRMNK